MSLSPTDSDKKVLRAFADRKPASNNRIESTGDRLNTIGFVGGGCIARWSGDHIIDFGYESGGKFGPALIRALKKYTAPNDWAKKNGGYEAMRRMKKNPTNRWGESFKKGDLVSWYAGAGGRATGRYVKLAPTDSFSRAYGRQAFISLGAGPIGKDPEDWMEVGLGDLKKESEARKNGSRYTARATSGRFWAGQSERFPWRRNPRAPSKYEHEYILQGNYGYGWDDLEFQDKTPAGFRELRKLKKTYEANQRGAYRIISRKTLRK